MTRLVMLDLLHHQCLHTHRVILMKPSAEAHTGFKAPDVSLRRVSPMHLGKTFGEAVLHILPKSDDPVGGFF